MDADPRRARKRPSRLEDELAAFTALCREASDEVLRGPLRKALGSPRSPLAARAAREVGERRLDEFAPELVRVLERFLRDPVKTDPGCRAKEAALEALATLEHPDAEPFLTAAQHVQMEPAWGPPVDTAATLRARAVAALAALALPNFLVLAGDMLGDPEVPVRLAAADSVAHHGDAQGAGLLLLAARRGDEDPVVFSSYLSGALRLAPEWALPRVRSLLLGGDPEARDAALIALGESSLDEAAALLLAHLEDTALAGDRAPILRALGFHRSERALEALTAVIAEGPAADAGEAIRALAPRRTDERVRSRVREAVAGTGDPTLEAAFTEAFEADPA